MTNDTYTCQACGQTVRVIDQPEHVDSHCPDPQADDQWSSHLSVDDLAAGDDRQGNEPDYGIPDVDRYQLAQVLADALRSPSSWDPTVQDLLADYDVSEIKEVASFVDLRESIDTCAEALRYDPTGDIAGVAVQFADGRRLRIRVDWI